MCKVWNLGILDFGFWGSWILDFRDFWSLADWGFWIGKSWQNFGCYIRKEDCARRPGSADFGAWDRESMLGVFGIVLRCQSHFTEICFVCWYCWVVSLMNQAKFHRSHAGLAIHVPPKHHIFLASWNHHLRAMFEKKQKVDTNLENPVIR